MRATNPKRLIATLAAQSFLAYALLAAAPEPTGAPTLTPLEREDFLLNAKIVSRKDLSVGVTVSQRATLTDATLTHDAHIQTIDERKVRFEGARGVELNFRDSYKFNIAAYRLDRLLGLNMIPVSVERSVAGKHAAVTW
jgi:hypothetical protein